jgi:rubrerythrin
MAEINNAKNNDRLIEAFECTIDVERTMIRCCEHLAAVIKNGQIRNKFFEMSKIAKENERLLYKYLSERGVTPEAIEEHCEFCKLDPESFSLSGALALGLEITGAAIRCYKDLIALPEVSSDKQLFKKMLKEKTEQNNFLKKEQKFIDEKEDKEHLGCIGNYCIPKIISKAGQ